MGLVKKKEDFRVVVQPREPGNFGFAQITGLEKSEEEWEKDCEKLVQQIKRHVDDIEDVFIDYDLVNVCEHCGSYWEDESSPHNFGCCDEDDKNLQENLK